MSTPFVPRGPAREVRFLESAAIDGTPVAYVVVLAAVVTALSFVPFSVVLATGGSFPMSQCIYGLLGWLLGPIAGALACGIGTAIGILVAPHTAGIWPLSLYMAMSCALAAGCFTSEHGRGLLRAGVVVWALLSFAAYVGRAYAVNHIPPRVIFFGSAVDWTAILLLASPVAPWVARSLRSAELRRVALGIVLGTWIAFGIAHTCGDAVSYTLFNWPEEIWLFLTPVMPVEFVARGVIGAIIGTGVIAGLRAIGLVKPRHAIY